MKSFTRIVSLVALALSFGAFNASADNAEDRIAQRVEAAEERFEKAALQAAEKLGDALDEEIEQARGDGDLDLFDVLEEQKLLYKANEVIPVVSSLENHAKRYVRTLASENRRLLKVYEYAISEYMKVKKDDQARQIEARIELLAPARENKSVLAISSKTQSSVIDSRAHKEFLEGKLREVNGSAKGDWIDMSYVGNKVQESIVANFGHVQYQNGRLREANHREAGDWIDTLVIDDSLQESTVKIYAKTTTLQYRGGRLREVSGGFAGEWITIRIAKDENEVPPRISDWLKSRNVSQHVADTVKGELRDFTLKHNERIVAERKQLQKAILGADEEEAIVDAKSDYKRQVSSIKQDYINELTGVLNTSLEEDRLEIASKIKTQILRVKSQIEDLSKDDSESDVPAIDDGGEEAEQPGPGPEDPEVEDPGDEPSDEDGGGPGFFGLPLE